MAVKGQMEDIQLQAERAMVVTAAIANQEMVATVAGAATVELVKEGTAAMEAIVPLEKEEMVGLAVMAGQGVVRVDREALALEAMETAERMGKKMTANKYIRKLLSSSFVSLLCSTAMLGGAGNSKQPSKQPLVKDGEEVRPPKRSSAKDGEEGTPHSPNGKQGENGKHGQKGQDSGKGGTSKYGKGGDGGKGGNGLFGGGKGGDGGDAE